MNYRAGITALIAASVCLPATAARPLELAPSSNWTLNYGPEKCTLMRKFGSGDSEATLQIDSYGSWNKFRVLVYGSALPNRSGVSARIHLRLPGDPAESDFFALLGKANSFPAASFDLAFVPYYDPRSQRHMTEKEKAKDDREHGYDPIPPRPDYDSTVDSLSIRFGPAAPLNLHLGTMAAPLAALRTCVDDLVTSWGGDARVQRSLSRIAKPVESTVKSVQADYPASMVANGINAYVPVRLWVDASGHPSNCVVQLEGVDNAFKTAVCTHLAGSFEPALDKDGHPVATAAQISVVYMVAG